SPPTNLVTLGPMPPVDSSRASPRPSEDEQWDLAIGGMHCASCVVRVEGALAGVPGVSEARVNFATESASVVVDPNRVDAGQLSEAVARAGYSAKRVELTAEAGAEAMRRE